MFSVTGQPLPLAAENDEPGDQVFQPTRNYHKETEENERSLQGRKGLTLKGEAL